MLDLGADPPAGLMNFVRGRRGMSAGSGAIAPPAPTSSTARLPAWLGITFASYHIKMAKMLWPLGTEQTRIEFSRKFCSEPVAMIHVVITVTGLATPAF